MCSAIPSLGDISLEPIIYALFSASTCSLKQYCSSNRRIVDVYICVRILASSYAEYQSITLELILYPLAIKLSATLWVSTVWSSIFMVWPGLSFFEDFGAGMTILCPFYLIRLQHISFPIIPPCNPSLLRHRKLDNLKHAYQACMDEECTTRESSDILPILSVKLSIISRWGSPTASILQWKSSRNRQNINRSFLKQRPSGCKGILGWIEMLAALQVSFEPIIGDLVSFAQNSHRERHWHKFRMYPPAFLQ